MTGTPITAATAVLDSGGFVAAVLEGVANADFDDD